MGYLIQHCLEGKAETKLGHLPSVRALCFAAEEQIAAIVEAIDELMVYVSVDGQRCINILPREAESNYVRVSDNGGCVNCCGFEVVEPLLATLDRDHKFHKPRVRCGCLVF